MRIAAIQADLEWEDHETNRRRFAERLWAAAGAGAGLVLLPEMFPTGFSMASTDIAEPPDGTTVQWMIDQASTHDIHLAGSMATAPQGDGLPTNRLVVAGPEGLVGCYDKIHPFSYGGEDQHYDAGSSFLTTAIGGLRTTFFVCYDLRFADEFWATAADTDLYVVVANWPRGRREHWQALLRARAIENQAYVAAVNRVGEDGNNLSYAGDSMVISPMGAVLASAAEVETILLAAVHAEEVAVTRQRFPFMADRRAV
ncbi:nitrilase-related carbon-nitrogen hydrolase [Euzebya tangerina]|uniref:nitrilase-related carbon-nitrogen hydrolase n=1 Tax=Euzebya tangerina TaxID=591198 RepID=UPI000E31A50B|nr:nitrilase-related carbon-nitrogen hydrolase [Euzebya tangerina]